MIAEHLRAVAADAVLADASDLDISAHRTFRQTFTPQLALLLIDALTEAESIEHIHQFVEGCSFCAALRRIPGDG